MILSSRATDGYPLKDNFLNAHAIWGYLGGRKRARVISWILIFFLISALWISINSLIGILSIWLSLSLCKAKKGQRELIKEPKISIQLPSFHSALQPQKQEKKMDFFPSYLHETKKKIIFSVGLFLRSSTKNDLFFPFKKFKYIAKSKKQSTS